jgi:hypothetical protein
MSVETAAETAAIEEAVGHYFAAVGRGEPDELAKAFHPDAMMQSVKDGTLVRVSQPEWRQRLSVKALADFPTFQFLDYLLLLKLDGRWQIVAKVFHRRDK